MLVLIMGYYWAIAILVFGVWFSFFVRDRATAKSDLFAWLTLMIGSSLWIVFLPFSYLELVKKSPRSARQTYFYGFFR